MLITDNKSTFICIVRFWGRGEEGVLQKSTLCRYAFVNVDNFERDPLIGCIIVIDSSEWVLFRVVLG